MGWVVLSTFDTDVDRTKFQDILMRQRGDYVSHCFEHDDDYTPKFDCLEDALKEWDIEEHECPFGYCTESGYRHIDVELEEVYELDSEGFYKSKYLCEKCRNKALATCRKCLKMKAKLPPKKLSSEEYCQCGYC